MQRLKKLSFLIILLNATLLTSCAGLHKNDPCYNISWDRLGQQDGSHGLAKRDLKKAYAKCGPKLIIDTAAYDKAWADGIKLYCNPRNGLALGMRGEYYRNVCSENQISAFDRAWQDGLKIYCVPKNGYLRGLEGKKFPGYCPPAKNLAFKKAYNRGYKVYKRLSLLKSRYEHLDKQIKQVQAQLKIKEATLKNLSQAFSHQTFSPQKQYEIQNLKIQIRQLTQKLTPLTHQRDAIFQKYTEIEKQYTLEI